MESLPMAECTSTLRPLQWRDMEVMDTPYGEGEDREGDKR